MDARTDLVIIDNDAAKIGDLYRKARASVVDSVHFLIEAGHRLIRRKEQLLHGQWLPWLETNAEVLGFDTRRTAARLMEVAAKWDAGVSFDNDQALLISRSIWGHNVRGTQGSGENEWHTPAEYLALARKVLGKIDLDPASSRAAQRAVKAKAYYTKETDGLAHEWTGRVWLNPPYSQPDIALFAAKMVEEVTQKHVLAAIMLTHNYTDTSWFQQLASASSAICFKAGRVRFEAPDGELASPTQGQAFFYFGRAGKKFSVVFSDIGFVVRGTS